MSNIAFLSHIGCFVVERFLSTDQAEALTAEILVSGSEPAAFVKPDDTVSVSDDYRRTKCARISKATRLFIHRQILSLKPRIEQHFNISLKGSEPPQALIYRQGDFFKLHKDVSGQACIRGRNSDRKISLVIFLNEQSSQPNQDSYCGGSLNLYGLIDQSDWKDKGFPVGGQRGLLIAFRSNILHEVMPVTFGERFTIVTWFF